MRKLGVLDVQKPKRQKGRGRMGKGGERAGDLQIFRFGGLVKVEKHILY